MGRALSQDLRDRVIAATGSGTSVRKAASRFEVGVSTAIKWVRRLRDTGERSARRQGRRPGSKLDAHGEFVRAVIDAVPDTTIGELQRRLVDERGVYASTGTIWTFLDRCDLTVKKKSAYAAEQSLPSGLTRVTAPTSWRSARTGSRASSISIRSSWCSSTRALPPPTWRADTAAPREGCACALRSRTAIGRRPRSWPGCG